MANLHEVEIMNVFWPYLMLTTSGNLHEVEIMNVFWRKRRVCRENHLHEVEIMNVFWPEVVTFSKNTSIFLLFSVYGSSFLIVF